MDERIGACAVVQIMYPCFIIIIVRSECNDRAGVLSPRFTNQLWQADRYWSSLLSELEWPLYCIARDIVTPSPDWGRRGGGNDSNSDFEHTDKWAQERK